MVVDGVLTPGTLIAFNSLVLLLQQPNTLIRSSVFLGSMGLAGGKRVFRVIGEQQQLKELDVGDDSCSCFVPALILLPLYTAAFVISLPAVEFNH